MVIAIVPSLSRCKKGIINSSEEYARFYSAYFIHAQPEELTREFIAVAQRDKVMTCRKCNLPNKTRFIVSVSDRNIVAATWSPSASGIDCQLPVERR